MASHLARAQSAYRHKDTLISVGVYRLVTSGLGSSDRQTGAHALFQVPVVPQSSEHQVHNEARPCRPHVLPNPRV